MKNSGFMLPFLCMHLFGVLASTISGPLIPLYAQEIGVGPQSIGFILGAFGLSRFIYSFFLGGMGDRLGHKRLGVWAFLVVMISSISFASSTTQLVLFFSRLVQGVAMGVLAISSQAILAAHSTSENRGTLFGYANSVQNVGMMAGPALAGFIAEYLGYIEAFYFMGVLGLMGGCALLFVPSTAAPSPKKVFEDAPRSPVKNKAILRLGTRQVLYFTSMGLWLTLWPLYTKSTLGLSASSVALLYAVYPIGGIFVGPLLGRFLQTERTLRGAIGIACVFMAIPAVLVICQVGEFFALVPSVVLSGIGGSLYFCSQGKEIADRLPRVSFGAILGKISGLAWLANAAGAWFSGFLCARYGASGAALVFLLVVGGILVLEVFAKNDCV